MQICVGSKILLAKISLCKSKQNHNRISQRKLSLIKLCPINIIKQPLVRTSLIHVKAVVCNLLHHLDCPNGFQGLSHRSHCLPGLQAVQPEYMVRGCPCFGYRPLIPIQDGHHSARYWLKYFHLPSQMKRSPAHSSHDHEQVLEWYHMLGCRPSVLVPHCK